MRRRPVSRHHLNSINLIRLDCQRLLGLCPWEAVNHDADSKSAFLFDQWSNWLRVIAPISKSLDWVPSQCNCGDQSRSAERTSNDPGEHATPLGCRSVHNYGFLMVKLLMLAILPCLLCANEIPNPLIDYRDFRKIVSDVGRDRESHRLTEKQFLEAMHDKNAVVLDARSASKFALRHVKGAISLPFTDFTADSLAQAIPSKATRILIYCNNNFEGSNTAFPAKAPAASLNLSTQTSLHAYGYNDVYELGPLLKVRSTAIPFEGTEVTSNNTHNSAR